MTADSYLQFTAMVAATGGVVYALMLIWKHVVCRGFRFLMSIVKFAEAQPVLLTIAKEFRKNNGATLRDQVDKTNDDIKDIREEIKEQAGETNIRLGNIEGQMEILVQGHRWDGETERRQLAITADQRDDEV